MAGASVIARALARDAASMRRLWSGTIPTIEE